MFINRKHTATHTLSLIASLALALTSCVQLGEEQEGAYGYLTISGFDVDVQVEQLVPTKTGETVDISTVPGYDPPTLSSVTVTSASDKDKSYTWENGNASLKLPADTYTLSATSGENGFGKPYYVGTGTVRVVAGQEATGTVEFSLGNSVMKVTNGMPEHFTVTDGTTVTISSGDKSVQTTMKENVTGYVFVPSDKNLKVEVTGNNAAGVSTPFSQVLGTATTAGKAYNVVITAEGVDLPEIKLEENDLLAWGDRIFIIGDVEVDGDGDMSSDNINNVVYEAISASSNDWGNPKTAKDGVIKGLTTGQEYKVRARIGGLTSDSITLTPLVTGLSTTVYHTDTNGDADGGDLDGTDVETTFKSPHTKVTELKPNWSFALYKEADVENNQVKANATPLRTYNGLTSDGSLIEVANGWPYLPQGDYKLVATATLEDGATVSSMAGIEVPAPEFAVTVSAYTTYDRYVDYTNGISGALEKANNPDNRMLVEERKAYLTISNNILRNENYKKLMTVSEVKYAGTELQQSFIMSQDASNTLTYDDVKATAFGQYDFTASVTFDGVARTASYPCHITGLPHMSSPPKSLETDPVNGWAIGSGNAHNWENGYLQLGVSGGRQEHTVYKDFHIPASINISLSAKISAHNAPVNTTCSISIGSTTVMSVDSDGGAFDYKTTEKIDTINTNMGSSSNKVTLKNSYSVTSSWGRIYYVNILYR